MIEGEHQPTPYIMTAICLFHHHNLSTTTDVDASRQAIGIGGCGLTAKQTAIEVVDILAISIGIGIFNARNTSNHQDALTDTAGVPSVLSRQVEGWRATEGVTDGP